jgi:hypothetical protein
LKLSITLEENKNPSYIPKMVKKGMNTKSISDSNHFVFYDHPKEMYEVIGDFIDATCPKE